MKLLEKIDIYGLQPEFGTFGKAKYTTWLGGVLTIISLLTVGVASFLFGQDFWFKTNPKVISRELVPEKSELIPLTSKNYTVLFRLEDDLGNLQPNPEGLAVPHFFYRHFKRNSKQQWEVEAYVDSVGKKCSETLAKDNPNLPNLNLDEFQCIDWEEIASKVNASRKEGEEPYIPVLGGTWEEDEIGCYGVLVKNSYPDDQQNTVIKDNSKVKDFLAESPKYVSIFYRESLFDASNLEEPINNYWKNYYYRLDAQISRSDRFFSSLVKLEDDMGWVLEDVNNSFSTKVKNTEIEIAIIDPNKEEQAETQFYCQNQFCVGSSSTRKNEEPTQKTVQGGSNPCTKTLGLQEKMKNLAKTDFDNISLLCTCKGRRKG